MNHAICRSNAVFAEHEPLSHLSGYPPRSTTGTFSSIGCHINRCRATKLTVTQHDQKRQYRCSQQRRTKIDRLGWWIASPGGNMGPRMKKKRYIFALITILLCHHYAFAADTSVITSVVLYPGNATSNAPSSGHRSQGSQVTGVSSLLYSVLRLHPSSYSSSHAQIWFEFARSVRGKLPRVERHLPTEDFLPGASNRLPTNTPPHDSG